MDGFVDLVRQFDVDWLAGTSFALYPLRVGNAKDVAGELDADLRRGRLGCLGGAGAHPSDRPLERAPGHLAASSLSQSGEDLGRPLDYGDDQTTPRIFEYHVQNSRAADLAAVLTQLLSSGSVSTVQPKSSPGSSWST